VNCNCTGQLSPAYNQFNQTTYFFNPLIGGSTQLFGLTQSLQLAAPITWGATTVGSNTTLTLPAFSWPLLPIDSGMKGSFVTPAFTQVRLQQTDPLGTMSPVYVFISTTANTYDILSGAASTAPLNAESVSPDGKSVYGRTFTQVPVLPSTGGVSSILVDIPPSGGCYNSTPWHGLFPGTQCFQPASLTRYQLASSGTPSFDAAATFDIPASTSVFPPSVFDSRYAYLKWVAVDQSSKPTGPFYLHRADPLTLLPVPNDLPLLLQGPTGGAPITGEVVGAYTYTGNPQK
jgi:hypothetical protein